MLGYKVMQQGANAFFVQAACMDANAAVTAAGTTQGTATELTNATSFVTTVAAGTGVILASLATAGDTQFVYNAGANPLKVYPPSGARINNLATNAAATLATNTGCDFHCGSSTLWGANLSA